MTPLSPELAILFELAERASVGGFFCAKHEHLVFLDIVAGAALVVENHEKLSNAESWKSESRSSLTVDRPRRAPERVVRKMCLARS